MEALIVDASIAVKWVVEEEGTHAAVGLERATRLAIELSHPAYDCAYLAAAAQTGSRFVTADERLLRVIAERASNEIARSCVSLATIQSGAH